ncbi:MAG: hypothetical protein ACUVV0_04135, partial [Anaerolineae bacterium]
CAEVAEAVSVEESTAVEVSPALPALSVAMSDEPDPVVAGGTLVYTIVYSNIGEAEATGVKVVDTLDPNVVYLDSSLGVPEVAENGDLVWNVGALSPDMGEQTLVITVTVNEELEEVTALTNKAAISCAEVAEEVSVEESTAVEVSPALPALSLAMSDEPDPVQAGTTLTYTIIYSNIGGATATEVWITDTLDSNLTFQSSSLGEPDGVSGNELGWYLGSLPVEDEDGDEQSFTISFMVSGLPTDTMIITNTVSIACTEVKEPVVVQETTAVLSPIPQVIAQQALTWNSSYSVQNLGGSTAVIDAAYYRETGYDGFTFHDNVVSSAAYWVPSQYPGASFKGGIIVNSSQPLASIANIHITSGGVESAASYSAFDENTINTTLYAPVILRNYLWYYTVMSVQNADANPINVSLQYYNTAGNLVWTDNTSIVNLPAGAAKMINHNDASQSALGTTFTGMLKAVATGKMAIAVVELSNPLGELYAYNAMASGAQDVYLPAVHKNYAVPGENWSGSISVVNLNGPTDPTNVDIQFYEGSTLVRTYTRNISAVGQFWVPSEFPELPDGKIYGVRLHAQEADNPLLAIVNQGNTANFKDAGAYNGIPATSGGTELNFPVILWNHVPPNYNYCSSMSIVNVESFGTSPANVTIYYYPEGSSTPVATTTASIVTSLPLYNPNHLASLGVSNAQFRVGSVKVVSSKRIAGFANEHCTGSACPYGVGDRLMTYDGFTR